MAPGAVVPLDEVAGGGRDRLGGDQHRGRVVAGGGGLGLHAHVDAVVRVGEDAAWVDHLRRRVLQRTCLLHLLLLLLVRQLCNRQLLLLLQG